MIFLFKYCIDVEIVKVSVFSVFKVHYFDSLVFSLNNSFSIKRKCMRHIYKEA